MARTRILIVEDEGIIARDIQRQVEDLGYEVVEIAGSAEEALALAQSRHDPPAVVVARHHPYALRVEFAEMGRNRILLEQHHRHSGRNRCSGQQPGGSSRR